LVAIETLEKSHSEQFPAISARPALSAFSRLAFYFAKEVSGCLVGVVSVSDWLGR
jgi:hypothetical protein